MSLTLKMSGKVTADPTRPTDPEAFSPAIGLDFSDRYDAVWGSSQPIASDLGNPFIIPLGAATLVRAVAVRAVDGQSLIVLVTSAAGTDQKVPVSDLFIVRASNDGDQFTAVKVVGTGRIEYLIGADAP